MRVWDTESGQELLKLTANGSVEFLHTLAVSPDSRWLASLNLDDLRLWEGKNAP